MVRADLAELLEVPLDGAPYGYTPFCKDRPEMEGFSQCFLQCSLDLEEKHTYYNIVVFLPTLSLMHAFTVLKIYIQ